MTRRTLAAVACAAVSIIALSGSAKDSLPTNPMADSASSMPKKPASGQTTMVAGATANAPALFDESKLSSKQKEFIAKKRLVELQYADSSQTRRDEKIAQMKSDILNK